MASTTRMLRGLALGAVAVVVTALGADAPPQVIDAGGLTFQVPETWKSVKPKSAMRKAQIVIPAAAGDADPTELIVYAFPGDGGGIEPNLERWRKYFEGDAKMESKSVKGKNVDVTRAETKGHYIAPVMPGSSERYDKENYHLLGAIVFSNNTAYFIRLIGPEKSVMAAQPAFDEALASIKAQ